MNICPLTWCAASILSQGAMEVCIGVFFIILGGKSAVLTALTVCLGCRASATQRGSSFDTLIKEGCNTAEVAVTIFNGQDPLAYRFDQYGESIIIERTLKRDGQHSFKIKNGSTGRVIESKKDEVMAICDHHSLLVDNPLVVLSQETSKKFLVNSTPKDLYTVPICTCI